MGPVETDAPATVVSGGAAARRPTGNGRVTILRETQDDRAKGGDMIVAQTVNEELESDGGRSFGRPPGQIRSRASVVSHVRSLSRTLRFAADDSDPMN